MVDLAYGEMWLATHDGKVARAEAGFCKPFPAVPVGGEGAQRRLRKATGTSVKGFAFSPPSLAWRDGAGQQ